MLHWLAVYHLTTLENEPCQLDEQLTIQCNPFTHSPVILDVTTRCALKSMRDIISIAIAKYHTPLDETTPPVWEYCWTCSPAIIVHGKKAVHQGSHSYFCDYLWQEYPLYRRALTGQALKYKDSMQIGYLAIFPLHWQGVFLCMAVPVSYTPKGTDAAAQELRVKYMYIPFGSAGMVRLDHFQVL